MCLSLLMACCSIFYLLHYTYTMVPLATVHSQALEECLTLLQSSTYHIS